MPGKSIEWIVLVCVVSAYLFLRSKSLPLWERVLTAIISAGLAYAGSTELAPWVNDSELIAAIAIMVIGPMILGAVFTIGEDEAFLKRTLQQWTRKRLGLGEEGSSSDDEA